MSPGESIAVGVVGIACVFDLHTRRIPNTLTLGAAAAALIAAGAAGGVAGLTSSLSGWLLATALWLPVYALGGMGAGDVKLLAAVGAWLGPADAFHAAMYAGIAGAIMALSLAVSRGLLRQTVSNLQLLVVHWQVMGFTPHAQLTLANTDRPRLAYALPILAGTVVAIWLR